MLKAKYRVSRPLQIHKNIAEIFPKFGSFRPELYRLVERLQRVLVPSLLLQCGAEACEIFRLWVLPDGERKPLYGVVMLFRAKAQQDHQMQGVGVI